MVPSAWPDRRRCEARQAESMIPMPMGQDDEIRAAARGLEEPVKKERRVPRGSAGIHHEHPFLAQDGREQGPIVTLVVGKIQDMRGKGMEHCRIISRWRAAAAEVAFHVFDSRRRGPAADGFGKSKVKKSKVKVTFDIACHLTPIPMFATDPDPVNPMNPVQFTAIALRGQTGSQIFPVHIRSLLL